MPGLVLTSVVQGPASLPARSTRNPSSLIELSAHVICTVPVLSKTAATLDAASGWSCSGVAHTVLETPMTRFCCPSAWTL